MYIQIRVITIFFLKLWSPLVACSDRTQEFLSHFLYCKKGIPIWKPYRKPANLSHFRVPALTGQMFNGLSIAFLLYKNGSKI